MADLWRTLPKAELHVHIEGTLEPELMFELARRNGTVLPYASVDEVRRAYQFTDLQAFLDVYYQACTALVSERDFYDLASAYAARAAADGVRHAEVFFDPQTHTGRGVPFEAVVRGLRRAFDEASGRYGMSAHLILCFLRHLPADQAMETLEEALHFRRQIVGVGLDSSEVGHPPRDFTDVFDRARAEGFHVVAHAGEEGPPSYIWEALDLLRVERIDHGVRCLEDPTLVRYLADHAVPLTVCPLSNVRLRVVDRLADHPLPRLVEHGVVVTVNSDDPAYFGGYIGENYRAVAAELGFDAAALAELARSSFRASFLDDATITRHLAAVDAAMASAKSQPTAGGG